MVVGQRVQVGGGVAGRLRVAPTSLAAGERPHVSVVIPHFEYGQYLEQAVRSALDQEGVRVSCHVVDDASSAEHRRVARQLADQHPDVELIQHLTNQGPVAAFNDGLDRAVGEFVVRLDADDLLTPGSLQRAASLMRAYPSVGLAYGHPLHFHGDQLPAARTRPRSWTIWPGLMWLERRCRLGYNCITSPEVLMRTAVAQASGGQRDLAQAHDFEMWLRLAATSDVGYVVGADQAWHREHEASRSARQVDEVTDLTERWRAFHLALEACPDERVAATLLAAARRSLVREAVHRVRHERRRGRAGSPAFHDHADFALRNGEGVLPFSERAWLERQSRVAGAAHPLTRLLPHHVLASAAVRLRADRARRRWHRTGV